MTGLWLRSLAPPELAALEHATAVALERYTDREPYPTIACLHNKLHQEALRRASVAANQEQPI